jgi:thioredoxin 1
MFRVNYDKQKDVMRQLFKARDRSTLIMFKGSKETGRLFGETDAKEIQALLDKGF